MRERDGFEDAARCMVGLGVGKGEIGGWKPDKRPAGAAEKRELFLYEKSSKNEYPNFLPSFCNLIELDYNNSSTNHHEKINK